MDVCPKCHNVIVYGMNCCTGKRTLNIAPDHTLSAMPSILVTAAPEPPEARVLMACEICGFTQGHDEWKHQVIERIDSLEKEIATLKGLKT